MASSKGPSSIRNTIHNGRNSLLPPKSPFPSIPQSYADYIPNPSIGPKSHSKPREGNSAHHRTSSESFLMEEQPSWLDELLDEPDTPGRKGGHRRSSSDSFAYIDTANIGSMNYIPPDDNKFKNITPLPSWGSQNLNNYRDIQHSSFYPDLNPSDKTKNKPWDQKEDPKFEKKDSSNLRTSAPETDTKRAKQQFAQRSRVRKLQYIAELERTVQALQMQAEGSEVSAELEFLNQQNLILSMENKALKHRLESLSQEQLIKYLEQEVLEREAGRLRNLYQQQQQQNLQQPQQQPKSSGHRRTKSRSDLDCQFANLSLKHKQANASHDSLSSQLHI